MDKKNITVGIDLGTSNSSLAYSLNAEDKIHWLPIKQIASLGKIHERNYLPSALFIPSKEEEKGYQNILPWHEKKKHSFLIGSHARDRGSEVPERYINSAKSWLCNTQMPQSQAYLPLDSTIDQKLSPLEVLTNFLEHLKFAFNDHFHATYNENLCLSQLDITLTVPASFDDGARNLTYEASKKAGLTNVTLLEEPQAALYSWIHGNEEKWREEVAPGDLVLVCDIGGGTSDFSLVCVNEEKGKLKLDRICVGNHLLLGGDNMDYSLAFALQQKLELEKQNIDHWQFLSLTQQARRAKELLLSDETLEEIPISIASRGSKLFAKTIKTTLTRKQMNQTILEGFFPETNLNDHPVTDETSGFHEYGLNYEKDPAISKHLAHFICQSSNNIKSSKLLQKLISQHKGSFEDSGIIMPNAILFNGGVFSANIFKDKVLKLLKSWSKKDIKELSSMNLDLAVSNGAVYSGKIRKTGKGIKIHAGTAHSYYLGIEPSRIAIPGFKPELKGLCIVPQGSEEGGKILSSSKQFGLVTGKAAKFHFFSSSARAGDSVGFMVDEARKELKSSSTLDITLPCEKGKDPELVPVTLNAYLNEIGILELSMHHTLSQKKWKLEYNIRKDEE